MFLFKFHFFFIFSGTFFIYQKASLEIYNFMKSRNIDSAWPDFIKAVGSKNLQHIESDIKAIDFLSNPENWNNVQTTMFAQSASIFDIFKLLERIIEDANIPLSSKKECIQMMMQKEIIEREVRKEEVNLSLHNCYTFFKYYKIVKAEQCSMSETV